MKFLRLTQKYVSKNFLVLLIASILPSIALIAFARPLGAIDFFYDILSGTADLSSISFIQIYQYFSIIDFSGILLWLPTFLIGIFLSCVIYCMVERKMKYGTYKGIGIRSTLKNCLFIMMPAVLLITLVLHLVGLLITTLVLLIGWMLKSWVAIALCFVFIIVIYCFVLIYLTPLVCWVPCMTQDGLNFWDAISLSVRLCFQKQKTLFATLITMFISVMGGLFAVSLLGDAALKAGMLAMAIVMLMYVPVYICAVYFELAELPRMDVKKRR